MKTSEGSKVSVDYLVTRASRGMMELQEHPAAQVRGVNWPVQPQYDVAYLWQLYLYFLSTKRLIFTLSLSVVI